jgi:hypothetical protein
MTEEVQRTVLLRAVYAWQSCPPYAFWISPPPLTAPVPAAKSCADTDWAASFGSEGSQEHPETYLEHNFRSARRHGRKSGFSPESNGADRLYFFRYTPAYNLSDLLCLTQS